MEQKKKGGIRLGAGRKPVLHKKKQISLYVENFKILPFGSEDKMKAHLYGIIESFVKIENPVASFQDLTKPTNEIKPFEQPKTNYEVKVEPKPESVPLGNFDGFKAKILETKQVKELESVMKEIKASLMPGRFKQQLEAIAKEHSKEFFTD
jgi:hypothetical protein